MNSDIKINEIFHSIQGETSFAGQRTVFVRTTGCNLRCSYCDTEYAFYDGQWMGIEEILETVAQYSPEYVCVTGGEPLLQKNIMELLRRLCDSYGSKVSLETSGSISCLGVDPRVKIILDIKTPGSKESTRMKLDNLDILPAHSEIKFVLTTLEEFDWAENFCRQHKIFEKFEVLYSPSFGQVDLTALAEKIISVRSPARLQIQLHKIIWSPTIRGV
jgi:7-carboxy-7-deazaguanine synthase